MQRPFTELTEPWAFVRHFTPNWFAMTMGTGVLMLVIARMPWHFPGQMFIAEMLWFFGLFLFVLFSLLFCGRMLFYRDTIRPMLEHPVQSMFLGAIPMGLAMQINGLIIFGPAHWGEQVYIWAYALWWLDAALAVASALVVPYMMFTRQQHALEKMTAVWLLPIVAPEVAASSAAVLAPFLAAEKAQLILACGFVLWGMSLALAFSLITLVLLRLALHKLPDVDFAATSWLPLGPLATGSVGILAIGQQFPNAFAASDLALAAEAVRGASLIAGMALWGAGFWWLITAMLFTHHYWRRKMSFNLGWWGFTFPLGVFALATIEIGRLTQLGLFHVLGAYCALQLLLVWLLVMNGTVRGMWRGDLFKAPCLADTKGTGVHGVFHSE